MHRRTAGWMIFGLLAAAGCEQAPERTQSVQEIVVPAEPSPAAREAAAYFAVHAADAAIRKAAALRAEKRAVLQKKRADAEAEYKAARERGERPAKPERAAVCIPKNIAADFPKIRYNSLIAEIYGVEERDIEHVFVRGGELTPAAHAILNAAAAADEHALDPAEFPTEKLENAAERIALMQKTLSEKDRFALKMPELLALTQMLGGPLKNIAELPEEKRSAAVFEVLCAEDSPIPRAAALCARELERQREFNAYTDALEFAFADTWLLWARTVKYGSLIKFSQEEREKYTKPENPNDIHPKYFDDIVEDRLRAAMNELRAHPENAEKQLADLIPQHEQYQKLQTVREKYRTIVKNGGWKNVPPDRMFAGGRAPLIKDLKTRLAAENYYGGPIDDFFDEALTAAIKRYQEHHQFDVTGEVSPAFWRSINVSAEQRLAEIEVNIRRWHKTIYEPRDRYIYINLPSFTVELWNRGSLVASHRAVVGNSTRVCSARTREWQRINATQIMHARMTYLVFNPYWNVPPRIEVDEYQKRMAEDPKWLENSDFEYYTPRGGGRILRQKPGENNALGRVKLIFPNHHNTYLHDTPKQQMFTYAIRAFSHGCIRVEGAMDLAKEILELDGQWDEEKIDRFFREKGEHPVDLNTPLDVFIDYHTVTVDKDGAPHFLADVYHIIRDEIEPPSDIERACDPAVDLTSQFRSGGGEDTGP